MGKGKFISKDAREQVIYLIERWQEWYKQVVDEETLKEYGGKTVLITGTDQGRPVCAIVAVTGYEKQVQVFDGRIAHHYSLLAADGMTHNIFKDSTIEVLTCTQCLKADGEWCKCSSHDPKYALVYVVSHGSCLNWTDVKETTE